MKMLMLLLVIILLFAQILNPNMAEPKLSKIFTSELPPLSAEQLAHLNEIKAVRTTPRDERFPSQNQALHCWNLYNEWLLCLQQTGAGAKKCAITRQHADSICPSMWTDQWDEQREEGTFGGIGSRYKTGSHH